MCIGTRDAFRRVRSSRDSGAALRRDAGFAIHRDRGFGGRAVTLASLNAVVPMACVTAAAIAAMTAEAFRDRDERMPIGPLGAIGLIGAAVAAMALWNHNATSFGVVVADNFG